MMMTVTQIRCEEIRETWASVPAPPAEDLKDVASRWGEDAARAFTGVAPMDVDRDSKGYLAAAPLLDLPPRAAAAYLGPFLLSALEELELQTEAGISWNITHRAHIVTCLQTAHFWERIWPFLTPKCRERWLQSAFYIATAYEDIALTPEESAAIRALADKFSKSLIQPLYDAVRDAWASVPAPPVEDMKYVAWGWGERAAREFIGVAPMDVDRESIGFSVAESLLELPDRAGAAYIGSFLLSALELLEHHKSRGYDKYLICYGQIIYCLGLPYFWKDVWLFLTPKCREVWVQAALYVASEHEAFNLKPEAVETMRALADEYAKAI
jgi:hypothetical protein